MTHIYITGLGIRTVEHATDELVSTLRRCEEVLFVDTGVATAAWLATLCPRVTDLYAESYGERRSRVNAYEHMAARVLEAALDHPPVAFAMQGHPLVYSTAPFLIREAAALLDLQVEVLPGISSLDCLFAELWLDPCHDGLQMYEATDLLLRHRPIQPDVPLLLWQVGNVETRLHSGRASRPERFDRLRARLLQTYPADHPVTVFFSRPHPLVPSTRRVLPLGELGAEPDLLHPGVTLYLPPVAIRPVEDVELLRLIDDPAHLRRITR